MILLNGLTCGYVSHQCCWQWFLISFHRDHGAEEAAPPSVFHTGVQGEIVERCRAGDRTAGQVARDFDLTETAVRAWVAQAETECRGAAAADQRGAGLSRFSWVRR